MKWHIHEDFYIEHLSHNVLALFYRGDDSTISFVIDDIDDMIEALNRAKSHFATEDLKKEQEAKLAIWGKMKTPTDTDCLETSY